MKRLIILVIALLSILLITRMEDYLGQQDISKVATEKDQVDYYLLNFSIMQTGADGKVTSELAGRHLSHWKEEKQSTVIAPIIFNGTDPTERTKTTADEAQVDQAKQQAKLINNVHIHQPAKGSRSESDLYTDHLNYDMTNHLVSTDAKVLITSPPNNTMQSTGLTGKLDEDLLRFNANVHSIYQIK
jgi:LPS export ABC transporter protein LptC